VEYRVLGPIELRVDGRPVAVGGPKPRALLALLLLNAGRVVPTSEVIEALWGDHPPASGATRVHGVVSELRAALARAGMAPGPLATHPHGYLLTLDGGELDVDDFEGRLGEAQAAAAQGQLAAAAAAYRAALELWRAPALAGVAAPFAGAEAARLEERRLVAVEELAEVDRAELRALRGDRDAAREGLQDALRRARDLELLYDQARALDALGELHAAEGSHDRAVGCLTEAVRLWRRVGIPRRLAAAQRRLERLTAT
jgi:DNA-binding SARP family transcriptional activator